MKQYLVGSQCSRGKHDSFTDNLSFFIFAQILQVYKIPISLSLNVCNVDSSTNVRPKPFRFGQVIEIQGIFGAELAAELAFRDMFTSLSPGPVWMT